VRACVRASRARVCGVDVVTALCSAVAVGVMSVVYGTTYVMFGV